MSKSKLQYYSVLAIRLMIKMFTKCTRGIIINGIGVYKNTGKQGSLTCRIYILSEVQAGFSADLKDFSISLKWNRRWMPVPFWPSPFASFLVNYLSTNAFLPFLFPSFFPFSPNLLHPLFFNPLSSFLFILLELN